MPGKAGMVVREYVAQLRETRKGKPQQIREALGSYVDLWDAVIKNGTVSEEDEIGVALGKLDELGGLYKAAE